MYNHGIKAIIFDLGNVLVDFDHMIAARRISKFSDIKIQEIFNLVFDSQLISSFEKGLISPDGFFLELKKILHLHISYEEFLSIWNEIFFLTPKNLKVYNIAARLKERYITALLSNINELHFDYLKKNFSVFDVFHKTFLSYEMHLRKPELPIYEEILKSLSLEPSCVFYTDDRIELVEAARIKVINSFQFTGVEKLEKDLSSEGVELNHPEYAKPA